MSNPSRQIDSLTPLRGIAALLVVVYHVDSLLGFMKLGSVLPGSGFFARGYLWVDFFFVLSGFIITHVYGSRFTERIERRQVTEYIRARFARIYPLHFFALCLNVLIFVGIFSRMPASGDKGMDMTLIYSWKELPFHFLLLLSFGLTGLGWNVPAWSIAAEWWTYFLALPLFRVLNRGLSFLTVLVPLLCAFGLWVLCSHHPRRMLDLTFDFGLVRCVLDFSVGICLYQMYRAQTGAKILASDGALIGATLLTVALLHFAAPSPPPPGTVGMPVPIAHPLTPILDALSPLVFALLILCAARNHGVGYRILNTRVLRYLGDISYSIYMMQGTAFLFFFISGGIYRQKHPTGTIDTPSLLFLLGGTLGLDLLMAMATYRWIEIPARRWLRGKTLPPKPTATPLAGETT